MIHADAYFFDIDGTLLVTRDLVHWNAIHQAMLEVFGVDTNIEGLSYHGKTDIGILRMALNRCGIADSTFDGKISSALAVVCREVGAHATGICPEVCPAIPEVLRRIKEERKLLGVASGNLESVGWHKVSAAGLRDFFSLGSFGDRCEPRAEIFSNAVDMARSRLGSAASVCFVGDTPEDIRAARHVQAKIIAVATGTFQLDALAALHPDLCCRSCADLLQIWPAKPEGRPIPSSCGA
jgi:phosphoglycolate phosphatase-like HAD superfamily hydrolase